LTSFSSRFCYVIGDDLFLQSATEDENEEEVEWEEMDEGEENPDTTGSGSESDVEAGDTYDEIIKANTLRAMIEMRTSSQTPSSTLAFSYKLDGEDQEASVTGGRTFTMKP
jgi:hypothetical protein